MSAKKVNDPSGICASWDFNADLLDTALVNAEIITNGLLTLTRIDGTDFTNTIPYFPNFIISGITLTLDSAPNADDLLYTAGTYQIDARVYTLASGGTIALTAGDPSNPRVDIVTVDTSNTINYYVGTPAVNPIPPNIPVGELKIVEIGVEIGRVS